MISDGHMFWRKIRLLRDGVIGTRWPALVLIKFLSLKFKVEQALFLPLIKRVYYKLCSTKTKRVRPRETDQNSTTKFFWRISELFTIFQKFLNLNSRLLNREHPGNMGCRSVCGRTEKFWCLIKLNELWFSLCTDGSRLELLANLVSDNYRLNILDATLAIKRKLLNSFPGESPNLIAPCDQILFSFVWNYGESPLETLMKHLFQLDTQMWVRFESWAYEKKISLFSTNLHESIQSIAEVPVWRASSEIRTACLKFGTRSFRMQSRPAPKISISC